MAKPQMITGSSAKRWLDIKTDQTQHGELVIDRISGTETLGKPFEYEVIVLHERGDLLLDSLLYMVVTVLMEVDDTGSQPRRAINGIVAKADALGAVNNFECLYRYRLVLRPWLWWLSYYKDCRIFQNKDIQTILTEVFGEYSSEVIYDFRLTGQYPTREYCVQYRESDLDFVSRLMEEEGIYYYFEHEDGKHKMVICDAPSNHRSIGSISMRYDDDRPVTSGPQIHRWTQTSEYRPNTVEFRDYNFETPSTDLYTSSEDGRLVEDAGGAVWVYDYPGRYEEVNDAGGGSKPEGTRLARNRLESLVAASYEVSEGRTDSRQLKCGALFTLLDHRRKHLDTVEFLVVGARIEASNNIPELNLTTFFDCRFRLIRSAWQYRSPQVTRRPVVQGPQTAVVVGPDNEEIHVDQYGRVKLHFHWDRERKGTDESSCWVRVSQIWAGKNYGWLTIPRIGQEVVVSFLEGNPDRPLVTGRVYNAEQMPPGELPGTKTLSGILSRSTPDGTPGNANSFYFDDKKGEEKVVLWAEKDNFIRVEHDEDHWVGNDRLKKVDNDETTKIGNNRTEDVGSNETITIGSDRTEEVGNNETITVKGNRTESVKGNEDLSVTGSQTETITGSRTLSVTGSEKITIKSSHEETILASAKQTVTGTLDQTVIGGINITTPATMKVNAVGGVTFTVPGGFNVIAPGGTKTVDSFFSKIGLKTEDIFSIKTNILSIKTDLIAVSNTGMQPMKIDMTGFSLKRTGVESANKAMTISQYATKLKHGAIGLYMYGLVMMN